MSEDLKRLVSGIEGEPPSAEFRARLRAQIVAETEVADEPIGEIAVVVDLQSRDDEPQRTRRSPPRRLLLACAAAAVLLIVGLWAAIAGDDEAGLDVTTDSPDDDVVSAEPLTAGYSVFEQGTFRIDSLGTAFTFEVEEATGGLVNDNGVVALTALTSAGADDRTIIFRRTNLLPDPAAPTARLDVGDGWPVADVDGWLAAVRNEVITASDPVEVTLGGFQATFVELSFSCDGGPCRDGLLRVDPDVPIFTSGSDYRMWVVDQGAEDPIVVTVAVRQDGDSAWFDRAETVLSTLVFGAIHPNPVEQRDAGSVDTEAFGGVSIVLSDMATVVEPHDGLVRIIPEEVVGELEFLTGPLDPDGDEVTSTEQVLGLLENEAVAVAELDPVDVGGQQARVFSVDSGPFPSVVLKTRPEDLARGEFGWESPQYGHLWVIEHPERGVLVASTESFDGPGLVTSLFEWAAELLDSLEFRDS